MNQNKKQLESVFFVVYISLECFDVITGTIKYNKSHLPGKQNKKNNNKKQAGPLSKYSTVIPPALKLTNYRQSQKKN